MYLLDDWGMGDTETRNRKYAEQSREHLLNRRDQQDGCDEVDLHPLSNQVRDLFIGVWYHLWCQKCQIFELCLKGWKLSGDTDHFCKPSFI